MRRSYCRSPDLGLWVWLLDGQGGQEGLPPDSSSEQSSRSTYFAMMSTSRLTRVPTSALPSVVRSNVVGINDTSNQSWPRSETVRDTPSTVIEPFSTTYR